MQVDRLGKAMKGTQFFADQLNTHEILIYHLNIIRCPLLKYRLIFVRDMSVFNEP